MSPMSSPIGTGNWSPFSTSSNPRIARQFLILSGLFVLFTTILSLLWFDPTETVQATTSFVSLTLENLAPSRSKCNSRCPADPFAKHGTLVYGPDASDTRWIPFPPQPKHLQSLNSSDIDYDVPVPQNALELACPQYMKMLRDSNGTSEMDWARDKTVLFIGSSHDRNNIQYFCEDVGGTYSSVGGHTAGTCNVTSHNLVLALWFTFGSVDSESYDWFASKESRPITFERKIEEVMLPWTAEKGINRPDLVIESSIYWDDNFFNQRAQHVDDSHSGQPLTYAELAWHRTRVHALVALTRSLYGAAIPIMLRTRHLRQTPNWNWIRRVFQIDQNIRTAATDLDVKLFTWGDLLEGESVFYDKDQHYPRGPVTWLFGDMMLFYLKQATTSGCWECIGGQR